MSFLISVGSFIMGLGGITTLALTALTAIVTLVLGLLGVGTVGPAFINIIFNFFTGLFN